MTTSNADITFAKTVDSYDATARTLSITAGGTNTLTFNGLIGATNQLNTTSLTASNVVITAAISMGAHALTVNADTLAISANISGTSSLTIQPKTITKTISYQFKSSA